MSRTKKKGQILPTTEARKMRGRGQGFNEATALKKEIERYWSQRGHTVDVWLEPVRDTPGLFKIRSDLVGGVPAGYADTAKRDTPRIRLSSGTTNHGPSFRL